MNVFNLSFGKDSMATLILAYEQGIPIDRVMYLTYAYDCPENRVDCYTQISEWAKELSESAALEVKLLKEEKE